MKKSRPLVRRISTIREIASRLSFPVVRAPTDDQAFHLLLSQNVDVQRLLQLVVELECTTSSSHNTQFIGDGAVALLVFLLELTDEVDADVDPVGFEIDEIQAAAIVGFVDLASEVD